MKAKNDRQSSYLRLLVTVLAALTLVGCSDDDNGGTADATNGDADAAEVTEFVFKEAAPESEGMDSDTLEGARDYAFSEGKNTQSVIVVRRGTIVAEWYADDRDESSHASSWSIGKSVTSALIGIAIDRGEIPSVEEPMTTYIPEWRDTDRADIVLRDVLEMASGLAWIEDYDPTNTANSDIAEMVLESETSQLEVVTDNEVLHDPGTEFNYSSGDTMTLSRVIEIATGESVEDYAQEHLFDPLGIDTARWWQDLTGLTLTYCCLDMTARDFARFGQLFLESGELAGRRIVPEAWVAESISPSPSYEGYGYQWWLTGRTDEPFPADTYSALGHDGQYIHVIPSLDLVVVRHGLYWPSEGEAVADPNLFTRYPSDGLIVGLGTAPPDSWSDAAFIGPILDSIQD